MEVAFLKKRKRISEFDKGNRASRTFHLDISNRKSEWKTIWRERRQQLLSEREGDKRRRSRLLEKFKSILALVVCTYIFHYIVPAPTTTDLLFSTSQEFGLCVPRRCRRPKLFRFQTESTNFGLCHEKIALSLSLSLSLSLFLTRTTKYL